MMSFNVHFEEHGLRRFRETAKFENLWLFFVFSTEKKRADNLRWEKFCLINPIQVTCCFGCCVCKSSVPHGRCQQAHKNTDNMAKEKSYFEICFQGNLISAQDDKESL